MPIVHNEMLFVTSAIDAIKGGDVMIIDISGAFLHALTKNEVSVLLRGPLTETLVLIDPEQYHPHIIYNKMEVPMLGVSTNKALYCCVTVLTVH